MSLKDKTALVIGGSSGIGTAICLSLAEKGAQLAIANGNSAEAEETLALVKKQGAEGITLSDDVTKSESVNQMLAQVVDRFSSLDILVHALTMDYAIAAPVPTTPITSGMTDDQWHDALTGTLHSAFYSTREALRIMGEQGSGKIVYVVPQTEVIGYGRRSHISAASGGILGLMVGVARRAAANGINMNAIAPGPLEVQSAGIEDARAIQRMAVGRLGEPEDIAGLVLYLVSDEAGFMVGQVVSPNGGFNTKWV